MSKTFRKYKALVEKRKWTENEIIYFRKALGYCGNFDDSQKGYLLAALAENEHDITLEQEAKGIEYLRNLAFKQDGSLRKTKDYPFGGYELNILRDFYEFKFVNLAPERNGMGEVMCYSAVYRVYDTKGNSFDYVAHPMGGVVVLRGAK